MNQEGRIPAHARTQSNGSLDPVQISTDPVDISTAATSTERLILHFHGLGPIPDWIESPERDYWCDEHRFTAILDNIRALSQVVPIEITFDDGNISDALIALPALLQRGQTATFFICAGRIGKLGYLDASAMNDLVSAGMGIGSHGWGHVDWRRVDDAGLDLEIDASRDMIANVIGRAIDKTAIPFGSYDRRVLQRLRRSNIKTVFTSDGGRAPLAGWMLPREVFRASWDDNRTLIEMATRPLSTAASVRRSIIRAVKRLR
jgi:peptidoglycan/xylan/chitin deacetylase (PgdA/CDA1 family)